MKCPRLFNCILTAVLAFTLCSCGRQSEVAEPKAEDSGTPALPAGLVEVSSFDGHPDSAVKKDEGQNVKTPSNPDKAEAKAPSPAASSPGADIPESKPAAVSDAVSDTMSDKASDKEPGKASGKEPGKASGSAAEQNTLSTTAITARGENPWSLEAQKVEYNEDTQRVRVKAIVWSLLDKNDKPRLTVRGRAADVNVETQNVVFDGPVDAEGAEGETMKVSHLVWDSAKQKILGSHGVRIVRKGTVMTGDNLVASPDLKQVEVSGNVRVTFTDRSL
ncbi:LPS export ABC transporter periplasmic protein LptC [bacterium]|nr:LPS export ABC transporter periplasmic protein LptC [bacterium]